MKSSMNRSNHNVGSSRDKIYMFGYEFLMLLWCMSLGVSFKGASTEIQDAKGTPSTSLSILEYNISPSHSGFDLNQGNLKQHYRSLSEITRDIMKSYSMSSTKSYKVILAPNAEVFSQVPIWYRAIRSQLPNNITVNVAIP